MSRVIEKTGKNVDEAVNMAIEELQCSIDDVSVEILDEGAKGIFGLIGVKAARVRVTRKDTCGEKAVKYLQAIFDNMNVNVEIDMKEDSDSVDIKIQGQDSGIIIGRRGETLEALQYLAGLAINNGEEGYKKVVIDIENYRKKREDTLIKLSNKLAERVLRTRRSITLEPMSPYERRIIHSTLQNNKMVKTYSLGDEPNRKVVITLK